MELTKLHETHYRGEVSKLRAQLEEQAEGKKLKGEVTLVIAPPVEDDEAMFKQAKGSGFDALRDAEIKCNILTVAKQLD